MAAKKKTAKKKSASKKKPAKKKPALKAKKASAKPASKKVTIQPSQPQPFTPSNGIQGGPKVRVLVAKPGLDGHDRGAKVIARALRDAGFEVVYTGLHQTPEMVINAAVQEDVQVIGLSILSGAHNALVPEIIQGVRKAGLSDALVLVGGIIPDEDIGFLKKQGVHMVFTPGASLQEVVDYIRANAPARS